MNVQNNGQNGKTEGLTRRQFLALSTASAATLVTGCAINPATGQRQLMFLSESAEKELDRKWAPHQFSADYGSVQDTGLSQYIIDVGNTVSIKTDRPSMPYNYRALNAVVVNAYTFPAGSMGFARGLLLSLQSEAELAAVMGHEMGHVSARHAAQQQTKGLLAQLIVAGVSVYTQQEAKEYTVLAAGLGALGASALLSRYSRDNERQADELGMKYMAAAGYHPKGMVGVMNTFNQLHERDPGVIELLFATHPMSRERLATVEKRMKTEYGEWKNVRENKERYMDKTASLRRLRPAIEEMQQGQTLMLRAKHSDAQTHFNQALKLAPADYAGLLMMSKCCLAQKKYDSARTYAREARRVYPEEPQAEHLSGMASVYMRQYGEALQEFATYETRLPGNPNTIFYRGFCLDNMNRKNDATNEYLRYLRAAPSGEYAGHSRQRLIKWGVIKDPAKQAE